MANEEHLNLLQQGNAVWNEWRKKNPALVANLRRAHLSRANLAGANLTGANLSAAELWNSNLRGVNLTGARLASAQLIKTDLRDATLTGSRVYGASVWDIKVNDDTKQQNLIITAGDQPVITVDNIKVAQFIYLLLNNEDLGPAARCSGKAAAAAHRLDKSIPVAQLTQRNRLGSPRAWCCRR